MARALAVLLATLSLVLAACSGAPPGRTPIRDGAGLDAQHQPHRPLRRAGGGLVRATPASTCEILPYNSTSPDTLVSAGAAEFGISFQDSFTYSKAAGADITSVMAVLQHWGSEIAVRADRADITSPARPRRPDLRRLRRPG